jgi:hypothetical protein
MVLHVFRKASSYDTADKPDCSTLARTREHTPSMQRNTMPSVRQGHSDKEAAFWGRADETTSIAIPLVPSVSEGIRFEARLEPQLSGLRISRFSSGLDAKTNRKVGHCFLPHNYVISHVNIF